jgi:hypothetical protein
MHREYGYLRKEAERDHQFEESEARRDVTLARRSIECDEETRQQLSKITNLLLAHREGLAWKETVDE